MVDELSLHDATLKGIHFAWTDGRCTIELDTVNSGTRELVFSGVTEFRITRLLPWGPSASINSVRQTEENAFEVELQSGDVLLVKASSWQLGVGYSA